MLAAKLVSATDWIQSPCLLPFNPLNRRSTPQSCHSMQSPLLIRTPRATLRHGRARFPFSPRQRCPPYLAQYCACNAYREASVILALCFHGLTNCFFRKSFILRTICVALECRVRSKLPTSSVLSMSYLVNLFVSESCGLFFALYALLRAAVVCFQSLTDSFAKYPGWGYLDALPIRNQECVDSFCCLARRPRTLC